MNEDLKAYVDGELPPDATERLRASLESDSALAREAESLRDLSAALRTLPAPEPVGQAATLAALGARRPSLVRGWSFALAGCLGVLLVASGLSRIDVRPRFQPTAFINPNAAAPAPEAEASLPSARRDSFVRYIHERGGMVRKDGDGLRAFYPQSAHEALKKHFLLPDDLPWPADGLKVRLTP